MTLTGTWQLAHAVSLRPEAFGGMAFHRERGVTLEVDREAYHFLRAYLTPRPLPAHDQPEARLVPQLVRLGFLLPVKVPPEGRGAAPDGQGQTSPSILVEGVTLSVPEAVHLAITTRCNLACPGCYASRPGRGPEWTVPELRGLIDEWAQMRVFQLAVGGGEPLLYEGLFEVLAYAWQQGIVPNLTTNGTLLSADVARRLESAGVARVNVSWNGANGGQDGRGQVGTRALRLLLGSRLQAGVNLLVTPALLPRLPQVLARLQMLGVRRVTLLRPKPSAIPTETNLAWYDRNRLGRGELLRLRATLNAWQGALELEVDSALVGLMGSVKPALLRWRGVYGCTAGRRICTVWPDGRVTPCSFLADLSAGNVRQRSFTELWARGENWERLRDVAARPQGGCTRCEVARQCGGARCVARHEGGDLLAGDAECPTHGRAAANITDDCSTDSWRRDTDPAMKGVGQAGRAGLPAHRGLTYAG